MTSSSLSKAKNVPMMEITHQNARTLSKLAFQDGASQEQHGKLVNFESRLDMKLSRFGQPYVLTFKKCSVIEQH